MKVPLYTSPKGEWFKKIPVSKDYPRHWVTTVHLDIELSDGYILSIKLGTIWDGASIPKWLWWLFKPIDEASIGDFIHDCLWVDKKTQLEKFEYNIFKTRLYADKERLEWRRKLAPKKVIKNYITHFVIRKIGGIYYSRQLRLK